MTDPEKKNLKPGKKREKAKKNREKYLNKLPKGLFHCTKIQEDSH